MRTPRGGCLLSGDSQVDLEVHAFGHEPACTNPYCGTKLQQPRTGTGLKPMHQIPLAMLETLDSRGGRVV
jgi:hypothetical protein